MRAPSDKSLPATPQFLQKEAAISAENVSSMDSMTEVEREEFNLMKRKVNYLRLCEAIKGALRDYNLNDPSSLT